MLVIPAQGRNDDGGQFRAGRTFSSTPTRGTGGAFQGRWFSLYPLLRARFDLRGFVGAVRERPSPEKAGGSRTAPAAPDKRELFQQPLLRGGSRLTRCWRNCAGGAGGGRSRTRRRNPGAMLRPARRIDGLMRSAHAVTKRHKGRSPSAYLCFALSSASRSGGSKKRSATSAMTTVIPTSSPSV